MTSFAEHARSAWGLTTGNNNYMRAAFGKVKTSVHKALGSKLGEDAFATWDPRSMVKKAGIAVRDIYSGSQEVIGEAQEYLRKAGTSGIATGAGLALTPVVGPALAAAFSISAELGAQGYRKQMTSYDRGEWVAIDNGWRNITKKLRNSLDDEFGLSPDISEGGFGDRPDSITVADAKREKQMSYGFFIDVGTHTNTVKVYNFQVYGEEELRIDQVMKAPQKSQDLLNSKAPLMQLREEYFSAQGFDTEHHDLIDHKHLLNVGPGSEVVDNREGRVWNVLSSEGEMVKVVSDDTDADIREFLKSDLVNGRVEHTRSYRHVETWVDAGWDTANMMTYDRYCFIWVEARPQVRALMSEIRPDMEVKDELAIIRAIVKDDIECVYCLDGQLMNIKGPNQMMETTSLLIDDERATLQKHKAFETLRSAIADNNKDWTQLSIGNLGDNNLKRMCIYYDYKDWSRANPVWAARLNQRQAGTKVRHWEHRGTEQPREVRPLSTFNKGHLVGHAEGARQTKMIDDAEEFMGKGGHRGEVRKPFALQYAFPPGSDKPLPEDEPVKQFGSAQYAFIIASLISTVFLLMKR